MSKIEHQKYLPIYEGKIYMGIDQSLTSTGITIIKKTGKNREELTDTSKYKILHSEIISTKPASGALEVRIGFIKQRIIELIYEFEIYSVGIESLAYAGFGGNSAKSANGRVLAGLFFTILSELSLKEIKYHVINITSLKKFVTNDGRADKIVMLNKIPEDNLDTLSEMSNKKINSKMFLDIVDSYWICRFAIIKDIDNLIKIKNGVIKREKYRK